jgi:ribulose-phosphate 3-epimerase
LRDIKISASIICANWMQLAQDLQRLEAEGIDYIHYDLMDGIFVEEFGLGAGIIAAIRKNTSIPSDYHLMIEEPARIIQKLPTDDDAIVTIHYEACRNLHRDLVSIRRRGFKVDLALNPATTHTAIEYVVEEVDSITVMTVNPGYTGSKLVPQSIKKIEALDKMRTDLSLDFEIAVDGNVNAENIPAMVAAGANRLVGGTSGLFVQAQSISESCAQMRECAAKGLQLRQQKSLGR